MSMDVDVKCRCGVLAKLKTSSDGTRQYYGCAQEASFGKQCDYTVMLSLQQTSLPLPHTTPEPSAPDAVFEGRRAVTLPTPRTPTKRPLPDPEERAKSAQKRLKIIEAALQLPSPKFDLSNAGKPSEAGPSNSRARLKSPSPVLDDDFATSGILPSLLDQLDGNDQGTPRASTRQPETPSNSPRNSIQKEGLTVMSRTRAVVPNASRSSPATSTTRPLLQQSCPSSLKKGPTSSPSDEDLTDKGKRRPFSQDDNNVPVQSDEMGKASSATPLSISSSSGSDGSDTISSASTSQGPHVSNVSGAVDRAIRELQSVPEYVGNLEKAHKMKDLTIQHLENEILGLRRKQKELQDIISNHSVV